MQIQEIQAHIKELFPQWKTLAELYKDAVSMQVSKDTTVLDIGCGRTDYMRDIYERAKEVIGQDPDSVAINENPCIRTKLVGDFEVLQSIEKESVDIAVSSWTLEHLPEANKLFIQLSHVLKPGGFFIASTPNKYSLTSIMSSIIPNKYHPKIVQRIWGRSEENTYPTYYKLNTIKDITKHCTRFGFRIISVQRVKDPSYYIQSKRWTRLVYRLHKSLLPKGMSEGLLITIQKLT